jgi:hypothetical protein
LLWTNRTTSTLTKLVGTAIFGGIGVMVTIGAISGAGKSRPTRTSPFGNTGLASERSAQGSDSTPDLVTESCLSLATQFGTGSKLSDLQKDELWKTYAGKSFVWRLTITDVRAGTFGDFKVQAKCAPLSRSLIQDVLISYDTDAKSFVMGLQKDDTYALKGVLKTSSTLLGMAADGVP